MYNVCCNCMNMIPVARAENATVSIHLNVGQKDLRPEILKWLRVLSNEILQSNNVGMCATPF